MRATPPELGGGIETISNAPYFPRTGFRSFARLARAICSEVFPGDEPAVRLHVIGDAIGNPPLVEHVSAVTSDGPKGLTEIGQHQTVPRGPFSAARLAIGGHRRREWLHRAGDLRVQIAREACGEDEAFLGKTHGRHHHVFPGQLSGVREIAYDLPIVPEVHRPGRSVRRALAVVKGRHFAGGSSNDHEATAADVARAWMRNRQRESGCDRGVNGVAAPGKD